MYFESEGCSEITHLGISKFDCLWHCHCNTFLVIHILLNFLLCMGCCCVEYQFGDDLWLPLSCSIVLIPGGLICPRFLAVSRHRTLMNVFDKAPVVDKDAFVAPSASIIGDVQVGRGSSIWYGCVLRGKTYVKTLAFLQWFVVLFVSTYNQVDTCLKVLDSKMYVHLKPLHTISLTGRFLKLM